MISEEITFLRLVEVTFVSGVDLHFHLGCLKLARLQQRHADLVVQFGCWCTIPGDCSCSVWVLYLWCPVTEALESSAESVEEHYILY